MIELKAFVSVFILTLLSAQNGQASTLGSNGTFRSPQRRSSDGKQIAPYLVWIKKEIPTTTQSPSYGYNDLIQRIKLKISLCRGAIISTRFILTSADCAVEYTKWGYGKDLYSSYSLLYVGLFEVDGKALKQRVKKIHISPTFEITDKENQCLFHSDVALFELENPLQFNDTVNKVKLPEPVNSGKVDLDKSKTNHLANANEFCTIVTTTDSVKMRIQGARNFKLEKIQLIDTNKCIDYLKTSNSATPYKNNGLCTDTAVCSYDETRKDSNVSRCHGSSGSPLVCGDELVGLVSWNGGDCHAIGIYTRVDVHVPWIQSVMKNTTQI